LGEENIVTKSNDLSFMIFVGELGYVVVAP